MDEYVIESFSVWTNCDSLPASTSSSTVAGDRQMADEW